LQGGPGRRLIRRLVGLNRASRVRCTRDVQIHNEPVASFEIRRELERDSMAFPNLPKIKAEVRRGTQDLRTIRQREPVLYRTHQGQLRPASNGRLPRMAPTVPPARTIFVAYPWDLYSSRAAYKKAFTKLESPLLIKFLFAEERITSGHVLEKILEMIEETAFGIYDVSSWNPNVTLEYGLARGAGAVAYIAFNPDKTKLSDVPADVRGYDRLQYTDLEELSDVVATLVTQQLGKAPVANPLEDDRQVMLELLRKRPGLKARELADEMGERLDYIQLLIRRSGSELATTGRTRAVKYFVRKPTPKKTAKKTAKKTGVVRSH
jgi:hypothetical protein